MAQATEGGDLAEHLAVRPQAEQSGRPGRGVTGIRRDGVDDDHGPLRQLGRDVGVGGAADPAVDQPGAVDPHRRIEARDGAGCLERLLQVRPGPAVGGIGFEDDPPAGVEIGGDRPDPSLGPGLGITLGRPVLLFAEVEKRAREDALNEPRGLGQRGPGHRAHEHPRRPDGATGQLGPGLPRRSRRQRLVVVAVATDLRGDVLEAATQPEVGRHRRAGRRADRGGRVVGIEAGLRQGGHDPRADADGHRTATADDDGEALPALAHVAGFRRLALVAATRSSTASLRQAS